MSVQIINGDTIKLLRECSAGIKMGITSINDVIDDIKNNDFKNTLIRCLNKHEELERETEEILNEYHDEGKEPDPIAKGMSWIKTNFKLALDNSDSVAADLITDGCNMGVKSLRKYLNQYEAAEEKVKDIAKRLITIEEDAANDIRAYL